MTFPRYVPSNCLTCGRRFRREVPVTFGCATSHTPGQCCHYGAQLEERDGLDSHWVTVTWHGPPPERLPDRRPWWKFWWV